MGSGENLTGIVLDSDGTTGAHGLPTLAPWSMAERGGSTPAWCLPLWERERGFPSQFREVRCGIDLNRAKKIQKFILMPIITLPGKKAKNDYHISSGVDNGILLSDV